MQTGTGNYKKKRDEFLSRFFYSVVIYMQVCDRHPSPDVFPNIYKFTVGPLSLEIAHYMVIIPAWYRYLPLTML